MMSNSIVEGYASATDGIHLYYRRLGRGRKVVVIPGEAWWGAQADTLSDRVSVILYDTRGRGRSDPATDPTTVGLEQDLADLDAIRLHLGLERFSLIGWSYLGSLVALYAAAHPNIVDRVVQVGPIGPRKAPHYDEWLANYGERAGKQAQQFKDVGTLLSSSSDTAAHGASQVRSQLLALVRPQLGDLSVADAIVDGVGTDLPNETPAALAQLLGRIIGPLGNWDFRPTAALVRAPVLTVYGSADNISLASCMEWVAVFPEARLLKMSGVGHYPFYERPSEFVASVSEFLVDERWPVAAVATPG
jgi:pimeloyl-ACP methyl ester carboxylesterase